MVLGLSLSDSRGAGADLAPEGDLTWPPDFGWPRDPALPLPWIVFCGGPNDAIETLQVNLQFNCFFKTHTPTGWQSWV